MHPIARKTAETAARSSWRRFRDDYAAAQAAFSALMESEHAGDMDDMDMRDYAWAIAVRVSTR